MPLFDASKADYFDSLFHCEGVVAVNTTGMIEAGIVGRTSFTLLAPEFAATQSGTVHFEHLTSPGFLRTATTVEEHHRQLDSELRQPSNAQLLEPFIKEFVRPRGLDVPATPIVVNAIEELGHSRRVAASEGWVPRLLRRALDRYVISEAGNVARDGQPAKGKRPPLRTPGTTPSNSA